MKRVTTILLLPLVAVILLTGQVGAGLATSVSIPNQTVSSGETFDVEVVITLSTEADYYSSHSRGAQFDLTFDPALLTCNGVAEGDFFSKDDTQPTYWKEPIIDNRGNGQILGAACIILSPSVPVSGSGVLATINFTAKELGESELILSNVVVGDAWGNSIEVTMADGSVTVRLEGDVNSDSRVNILDMILVGMHWGEGGEQGWISADINQDGTVSVLDSVLVGLNWTG